MWTPHLAPCSTFKIEHQSAGHWMQSFALTASGLKWPPAARQLSPVSPTAWTWIPCKPGANLVWTWCKAVNPCKPAVSPNTLPWILTWPAHFHKWYGWVSKTLNLFIMIHDHTCSMLMVPVTPLLDSSLTLAVGTPRSTAVQSKILSGKKRETWFTFFWILF